MYNTGDLLFTLIGSDENAISAVTEGYKGARVNHVGVIVCNNYGVFVLEAFYPEVRVTSIDVHLRRSLNESKAPRSLLGRLNVEYRHLIPEAVKYGLSVRNTPYDDLYLTDPKALYCSELVVDMFAAANGGQPFFIEEPMSFKDLKTGKIHPAWIEYYAQFGMSVPEGEPGSNPGALSKDPRIEILEVQGPPVGYCA